jgi:hypothetical protein
VKTREFGKRLSNTSTSDFFDFYCFLVVAWVAKTQPVWVRPIEYAINNAINHKKTSINNKIQWPDKLSDKWLTGHLDARELEQFDAHVRTELPRGFPPTLKDKHLKVLERLKEAEPLTTAFLSEFSGTSVAFAVGLTKVVGATTTRNRQLSVVAAIARITRHTGTQGKRGPGEGGGEEGGGGKRARET